VPLKVPGRGSRRKRRLQTAEEKGRVAPPKRNQVIRNVPRPVSPTPAPGAAQVRNRPQSPTPSTRERRELSLAVARRRHERALVDMDVPVYYQFLASRNSDVEELLFRGMLVDISPAGMGLVGSLHPSLHEDDVAAQPPRMVLHLSLPFVQRDLMVVGRLRHLRHGEAAKQWHLGVAIEHLTPQAELAIRRFLVVLHTGRHGSVSRLAG
jgi:hypothetical protein